MDEHPKDIVGCFGRPNHPRQVIADGVNFRTALRLARSLGASVEEPRRTGEVRFRHGLMERSVLASGRRKDAPRAVTGWLRELARRIEADGRASGEAA